MICLDLFNRRYEDCELCGGPVEAQEGSSDNAFYYRTLYLLDIGEDAVICEECHELFKEANTLEEFIAVLVESLNREVEESLRELLGRE